MTAPQEVNAPRPAPGDFSSAVALDADDGHQLVIHDPTLMFSGAYERDGDDLVIRRPFETAVIHDYFRGIDRRPLYAPDGSALSGAVVSAITLHNGGPQFAQTAPNSAPQAIGRIEVVRGGAHAIRNGQSITLHVGDLVLRGDAVQTDAQSLLSLTFLDGTAFTLESNARMVLNDMVYDPQSASNSSLMTLVQGSIGFVAGEVAHTGEMKVDTPVATIGIRGTAVHVVVEANHGRTHFSVMREPNGRVGRYVLYDHNDPTHVLASVADVNAVVTLDIVNGVPTLTTDSKPQTLLADEDALTNLAFQAYQAGQAHPLREELQAPNSPAGPNGPTPNGGDNGGPNNNAPDQSGPQNQGGHIGGGNGGAGGGSPPLDGAPNEAPAGGTGPNSNPNSSDEPVNPIAPEPSPTAAPQLVDSSTATGDSSTPLFTPAAHADPISVLSAAQGGVVGPGAGINLLAGATDSTPGASLSLVTNSAGQPIVTVGVVSGNYNPANLAYSVAPTGALQISLNQPEPVTPGTTVTLAFHYTLADSAGATAPQTAMVTIDGGSAVSYGATNSPIAVGSGPVTLTPSVISPEGGDNFAIDPPGALLLTQKGQFGAAVINTQTGQLTYTPSATPGTAGVDSFTVSDTDQAHVTTKTSLSFAVDGGALVQYANASTTGGAVADSPSVTAPTSVASFAFSTPTGPSQTEIGAYGAAVIAAGAGVITYTPSGAASGTDTFLVTITDANGVVTTASAAFAVNLPGSPSISGATLGQITHDGAAVTPFANVVLADPNANASETLTITLSGGGTLSGAGLSGGSGAYSLSGSPQATTQELDALSFIPARGAPNSQTTTTFKLSDKSDANFATTVNATTSVTDVESPVAPTVSGGTASQTTADGAALAPFAGVSVADANANATDTLTITLSGGGVLSGTGLLAGASGSYALSGSAAQVTQELDALSFAPTRGPPNSQTTTTFTLSDKSAAFATPAPGPTIAVSDVESPVAPTVSGGTASQTTADGAALAPFAGVSVADPNANATDTLTITLSGGGVLSGTGLLAGASGSYTLSGSAAQVTQEFDALSFAPTRGPPNSQTTTTFTLSDKSAAFATPAPGPTIAVTDVESPVAPTVSGGTASQTTADGAALAPFAGVSVADANANATDTLTITLSGGGVLSGTGLLAGASGSYTLSGSAAQVTQELDALSFAPTRGPPNSQTTTTFTLSDKSAAFATPAPGPTIAVTDVESPVAPTVSGGTASQTTADGAALAPFAGVSVADANANATDTLTITLSGGGVLSGTGLLAGASGSYTLSGSAAQVTQELDALSFAPTRGPPNSQTTTTFTLSDKSAAFATPAPGPTIAVSDVESPVAPTVSGGTASQTTADGAALAPFAGVSVADPNANATDTLTITLSGGGVLSGTGLLAGASGSYTLSGSAAQVTQELDALSFAPTRGPPNSQTTTTFTLSDKSAAFATPAPGPTIAVTDVESPVAPTVSGGTASQTTADGAALAPFAGVSVADPNANATDTLTITLSGGGVLSGTGLLAGASGNYALSGSAAQVTQELDALSFAPTRGPPNSQTTTTFTLSDKSAAFATPTPGPTIAVSDVESPVAPTVSGGTASQTTADGAALAPFAGVSVADANANATDTLTITLSGGGVLSGTGLLAGASGSYTLSGSAAQVTQELDALSFAPTRGPPNSQTTTTFTLSDKSAAFATPAPGPTIAVSDVEGQAAQPVVSFVTPINAVQGSATAISGLTVAEAGATATETFTVAVSAVGGALSAVGATGDGSGQLTIAGSLADVDAALGTLTFAASQAGANSITVVAADSLGGSSGPAEIAFVASALTPEISAPAPLLVAVGVAKTISGLSLAEAGAGAGANFTVTAAAANGDLLDPGATGSGTHMVTLTGDLAAINAALATLAYAATSAGDDSITLAATDSFGNASPAAEIAVKAVPLAPVISVGVNPVTVNPGTPTSGFRLSLSEPGAPASMSYTAVVTDSYGDLSVTASGATVDGENTTRLTVSGSLSQVNAALATLTDVQKQPFNDLLTVSATDSENNAAATRTLVVAPASVSLGLSAPGALTAPIGTATAISGVSVSENDVRAGETFSAVVSDGHGTLSANGAGVAGDDTTTLTVTGSLSEVNAALATLKVLEPQAQSDGVSITVSNSLGESFVALPVEVTAAGPLTIITRPSNTVNPNTQSNVYGVSIAEAGVSASTNVKVGVSSVRGLLYDSGAGVTVAGAGSTQLTLKGAFFDVQSALNALLLTESTAGADTLTVTADDSLGQIATAQTIAITALGGGQSYSWTGASSSDVGTASNWSVNGVAATSLPGYQDSANFQSAATVSGDLTAAQLNINAAVAIQADLTTTIGGYTLIGGGANAQATVNAHWLDTSFVTVGNTTAGALIIGAGGVVTIQGGLDVGFQAGAPGTLTIENGGELFTSNFVNLGDAPGASAVASVTGAGSQWIATGNGFVVGDQGEGALTISNDAVLSADSFTVGANWSAPPGDTSTGTVIVETGAVLTTLNGAVIGDTTGAAGAVTVQSSAVWNAGDITVGLNGGAGTLTVDNGRVLADGVTLGASYSNPSVISSGDLVVEGGGLLVTSGLYNDVGGMGVGTATVEDAGSNWTAAGFLTIGYEGSGGLTVQDDATVQANILLAGENFGAAAGVSATGELQVLSGGVLTTSGSYANIGDGTGGSGAATVDGAGSRWTAAGYINVGANGGEGTLEIGAGGSVVALGLQVGDLWTGAGRSTGAAVIEGGGRLNTLGGWNSLGANGGVGSVTVTGAGSTWVTESGVGLDDSTSLAAVQGGVIQAATGIYPTGDAVLFVDATSSIEAGSQGGAAPGYLTVDPLPNNYSNLWGAGVVDANVRDFGDVYADHGTLAINGAVSGDGFLVVGGEATLSVSGAITIDPSAPDVFVGFAGLYGTLALADPAGVTSSIANFTPGDTLDLSALPYVASASSYTITQQNNGLDLLTVTEGTASATLQLDAVTPLEGALQLSKDAAGTGTDIAFANAPASPFVQWSTLGDFFTTPNGAYATGATWSLTNAAGGADPIWVASETTGSGTGAQTYNIVITAQNRLGEQQAQTETIATTTLIDPFGAQGNLGAPLVFVGANYVDSSAGVVWWQASATPGAYDVKFENFDDHIENVTGATPAISLLGGAVTLNQGVSSPTSWSLHSTSTGFILEYTTEVTPTTENVYLQAFNTTGQATTPLTTAFSDIADSQMVSPGLGSDGNLHWSQSGGSQPGFYGESFNMSTGALGTPFPIISGSAFSQIYGSNGSPYLSNDDSVQFTDGVQNGQHVIQVSLLGPNLVNLGVTQTIPLQVSTSEGLRTVQVFDNDTGKADYTVLAYLDAGQVHLDLFDDNGKRIGADFVVPNATSLLRLQDVSGGPRFEIDYTVPDGHGGENVVGAIYDVSAWSSVATLSDGAVGYGLYAGSPYDDVFFAGPGVNIVQGGGGKDTFDASGMMTAEQITAVVDAQGNVVLSDGAGDVDTLIGFSTIKLADATIAIAGDVLTESHADGSRTVSTFNIAAEPYVRTVTTFNAQGASSSQTYYSADGSIYFQAPATVQIAAQTPVESQQGVAAAVPGLAISEAGAVAGETFAVTLGDATGALAATGAAVVGSGGNSLTISGSLAEVNAALATVTVTESAYGEDAIAIKADDSLGGAVSTASIAIKTAPSPFQFANAAGGDWNSPANWNLGVVPGPTDSAAISVPATVSISGGDFVVNSLASVPSAALQIVGASLTITTASDLQGRISLNGGQLLLQGDQSLGSGVLDLGGLLWNADPSAAGAKLTLGPGLTVNLTGNGGIYSTNALASVNDVVTSYATVNTGGGYATYIQPDTFSNHGAIVANNPNAALFVIPTNVLTNYGAVSVANGEQATLGDGYVSSAEPGGVTNANGATITASGSGSAIAFGSGAFVNDGLVQVDDYAHVVIAGPVSGSGEIALQRGGDLTLDAAVASGETVASQHAAGYANTLVLADPADFAGEISGFTLGDAIDLSALPASSIQFAYIDGSQLEVLTTNGQTLSLSVSGQLAGDQFDISGDGGAGASLTVGVATSAFWLGTGGDWSQAANWANGVTPTASLDVNFAVGGADVVTVTSAASAASVTVDALGVDIEVQTGGSLTVSGALTLNGGTLHMDGGAFTASAITVGAQGLFIGEGAAQGLVNNGYVEAQGNFTLIDPIGAGDYQIDSGVTLEFGGVVAAGTVTFGSATGELKLDDPANFHGQIAGLSGSGDVLYLSGVSNVASVSGAYDAASGLTTLTVSYQQNSQLRFELVGDYSASSWTTTPDAQGVAISDPPAAAHAVTAATIAAGPGDHIFLGGAGDTFVFTPVMGDDAIAHLQTDPQAGPTDVVDLKAFHIASYQALLASAQDTPEGELLDLAGHTLALEGVHKGELHSEMFQL